MWSTGVNTGRKLFFGFVAFIFVLLVSQTVLAGPASLKISQFSPRGDVERLTQVVVRFSEPMRALGVMEISPEDAPLRIEPRPAGSFRWLDNHTLAYILDTPLIGATRLNCLVPAGVTALNGAKLAKEFKAHINTPAVSVTSLWPEAEDSLGKDPVIRVTFNQPVELDSLNKHAYLQLPGSKKIPLQAELVVDRWQDPADLSRTYALTLPESLPLDTETSLVLAPGIKPSLGLMPTSNALTYNYVSYKNLTLNKWELDRDHKDLARPGSALSLEFNNPVDAKELIAHLRITPAAELQNQDYLDSYRRWFHLAYDLQPRTSYRLELLPGLKDEYGTQFKPGIVAEFTTGDLRPIFYLAEDKGVLESGPTPRYPLFLRNIEQYKISDRFLTPEKIAPAFVRMGQGYRSDSIQPPLSGPEVKSHLVKPDLPLNQRALRPLNLEQLMGQSVQGGLVELELSTEIPDQEGKLRPLVRRALIQTTDIGLSLKLGVLSGAAWVTRLSTGEPLAGADLRLVDRENRIMWSGVSNEQGLAELPALSQLKPAPDKDRAWREPEVYLIATSGPDLAVLPSNWRSDLESNYGWLDYKADQDGQPMSAHVITQLPLYQPGQTVRYAAYLRLQTNDGLAIPQPADLSVLIRDPYGRVLQNFNGRTNKYGSVSGEFALTDSSRLGDYSVYLKANDREYSAGSFQVASFRPPDYKVELGKPEAVFNQESVSTGLSAAYLFGAPVVQAKAQIQADQQLAYFVPEALNGFAVGALEDYDDQTLHSLIRQLGTAEVTLDNQGQGQVALPAAQTAPGRPVQVSATATVADAAGLTVSGQINYIVHPAAIYLGLKMPYILQAEKPTDMEFLAVTYDNKPAQAASLKITAYKQIWETVRERGSGSFYHNIGHYVRSKVWEQETTLPAKGATVPFTPAEAGTYLITAEVQDAQGRQTITSTYAYATGQGMSAWQRYDGHQLDLVAEKNKLEAGETARILIQNPFRTATAWVSVERAGVLRNYVQPVEGPAPVLEIPLSAQDAPNIYVSVLLIRGRIAEPKDEPDLGKPQVRLGQIMLNVDNPLAGLSVTVTPDNTEARPGQQIKAEVRVSSLDEKPRQAEIVLLAVDERVLLAGGGYDNYDPRLTFTESMPLRVITADLRTQVVGQRFVGEKGAETPGGGGLGQAMRQNFHPAVFWLAQAETDSKGRLQAEFTLPDSLTAYRLVAVAADAGSQFGLGKAQIKVSKPLQILSGLPRFAVKGDQLTAQIIVQNFSKEQGQVTVSAETQGASLAADPQQVVVLEPGQGKSLGFPVVFNETGQAKLTFRAAMGSEEDNVSFALPILNLTELTTAAQAGLLNPAGHSDLARVPILVPAQADPQRSELLLSLAPSPAGSMLAPLRLLREYPWDCLEQRLSKAVGQAWFSFKAGSLSQESQAYFTALNQQIPDFQTDDGGFAFWPGMTTSNLFLTAYTLMVLHQLQEFGLSLDQSSRKNALDYLQRHLKQTKPPQKDQTALQMTEALALWTLCSHGRDVTALLDEALTRVKGAEPFTLAALIQTAHLMKNQKLVDQLVAALGNSAVVSAAHLHFSSVAADQSRRVMGSPLRDNALVLWSLSQAKPDYPRLEALAVWLSVGLGQHNNLSTQEAAFALLAMKAYLATLAGAGAVEVRASLSQNELVREKFSGPDSAPVFVQALARLLPPALQQELLLEARGNGHPYWNVRLRYAPSEPPDHDVNAGLGITREIKADSSDGSIKIGDTVTCHLIISVTETRYHVLVHDPYPAGLEPLYASMPSLTEQTEGDSSWQWRESRQDGLLLYAPTLDPGIYTYTYKLRAMAPGVFQHRPAKAEEMYTPEVFGASAGSLLNVR